MLMERNPKFLARFRRSTNSIKRTFYETVCIQVSFCGPPDRGGQPVRLWTGTSSSLSGVVVDQSAGGSRRDVTVKNEIRARSSKRSQPTTDIQAFRTDAGMYHGDGIGAQLQAGGHKRDQVDWPEHPPPSGAVMQVGGSSETVVFGPARRSYSRRLANITTTLGPSQITNSHWRPKRDGLHRHVGRREHDGSGP